MHCVQQMVKTSPFFIWRISLFRMMWQISSLQSVGNEPETPLDFLIVTPGLTGASTTASITLTGPAFDVAFENLRPIYPRLNFSHTYIYNYSIKDCNTFQNEVQNILSQWYYCGDFDRVLPIYIVTPGNASMMITTASLTTECMGLHHLHVLHFQAA